MPKGTPGLLQRLAPLAFVAGLVLLGLGLLVVSYAAGGIEPRLLEYREEGAANGTAYIAYPIPITGRVDLRLDVAFSYPEAAGAAFTTGCRDLEAVKAGREPLTADMRTRGHRGSFATGVPATPGGLPWPLEGAGCPFMYVVFRWDAPAGDLEGNRPEVQVRLTSLLLNSPAGALAVLATLLGAALASAAGISWGRRLNRGREFLPAPPDESTAETLLRIVERSGDWLERTRRYLVLAGVLGIFLWYPVLLPWAWAMALQGAPTRWLPWLFAGGALAVLLALTTVWAREYIRLDRELHAWRERIGRLRAREAALLSSRDG